eukprot:3918554-Prymnesium_polylepis.1
MRVAVGCSIAQTFARLGFVPTAAAPHPLDWWPMHLLGHLNGARIIEAWLLARLRAGLGTRWAQVTGCGHTTADRARIRSRGAPASRRSRSSRRPTGTSSASP